GPCPGMHPGDAGLVRGVPLFPGWRARATRCPAGGHRGALGMEVDGREQPREGRSGPVEADRRSDPGALPRSPQRGMSLRTRALINVVSNWAALATAAAVTFFLTPLVVHGLGPTVYGTWALLGGLVGYMGLVDLGVRGAVTRYVSAFHAAGSH